MKRLVYAFFNSIFQAVKMTSVKTQVPYDYYTLPFCDPIKKYYVPENLGICLFVVHMEKKCSRLLHIRQCAMLKLLPFFREKFDFLLFLSEVFFS